MWWFSKLPPHLPRATGPYVPGYIDIMLEYSISGLFFRLYYPTNANKNDTKLHSKWIPWLPDYSYILGFAKVIMIYPLIIRIVLWLTAGHIRIPALYGEKVKTDKALKCIVFSHGFGSSRFLYSAMCIELASRGYLVLTVEHRDETACNTYYYKTKDDATIDLRTAIEHVRIEFGKGNYTRRNVQVHKRADECNKALDFLINLNKGQVPHNILNDFAPNREFNFKLEDLIGKIDVNNFMMSGHSFGGATAILTLSQRKEFKYGILLDPWMFPIKDEPQLIENVTQPLLFVNTQTFHLASNVKSMQKYLNLGNRQMFTMLHTTHENQTDSVFAAGYWLNWFMKKLDPRVGNRINNYLILKYLKDMTGHLENIDDCEKYLNEQSQNFVLGLTKPWA